MITPILLASLAAPITWQQIEMDQKLILNAPVVMNEKVSLKAGTKMVVKDILPLDQIRVLSYKMELTPCSAGMKKQAADMVIVDELYGLELKQNCELDVFVELGDLSKNSLFNAE